MIFYWINLNRKLMVMMRGLTISPGGGTTNGQKRNISKTPPSGYSGRTPKRLSGRLRDRSALDFSFSFVCGAGVCLSRRACGAPRNERSEFWGLAGEPTCIRQAHTTVPKGSLFLYLVFHETFLFLEYA